MSEEQPSQQITEKKTRNTSKKMNKKSIVTEQQQASAAVEASAAAVASEAAEEAVVAAAEEAAEEAGEQASEAADPQTNVKIPKKRGRKPKGGKIVQNIFLSNDKKIHEPNIIMHLKCGESDIAQNAFSSPLTYEPNISSVETFQFDNTKSNDLGFSVIDYGVKEYNKNDDISSFSHTISSQSLNEDKKQSLSNENDEQKQLWNKLKELTYQLHTNSISDKKSACFWCTYDFDNPTILIPKYELNKIYQCYGCFCSPECATAYLFEESIDTSTRFERYHLLNHIYCKIYNYDKNIKPAPNPYYTLNKYYGNLSIQEYRKLLKNERLLLIVDKPLSRVLPELHEDNDDYMFNGATISTSNKFKLRRKTKQTKSDILSDTFNLKA